MKTLFAFAFIAVLSTGVFSQPLSGSFTIGGNTPDFATLQEAADTLEVNGVSGPVFFNVRPGIYMKNNGNNTVLILDGIVPGLSAENRITFQPDDNAGGNVGNVILQMNIDDPNTANSDLVRVSLNYVTFHNLTFQEADASQHIAFSKLVHLLVSAFNVPVIGIVIDGCKFVGSAPFGTENGIELAQAVRNITVRGNIFLRLLRGISGMNTWFLEETLTIEDNQFLAGWRSSSGSGNQLGSAMEVHGENVIIKRNIVDFEGSFNGGYRGVYVAVFGGSESIIVEQNSIKGTVSASLLVQGQGGSPDSFVIANNMINVVAFPVWANEAAYGISILQNVGNAKILFNTVLIRGGGLYALRVEGEDCIVHNNIVIAKPSVSFNVGYEQATSLTTNIQSDYNLIFMQLGSGSSGPLVIRNGVAYSTLGEYQAATGLDTNSISKDIDFIDSTNLHISDCQAQDPDLKGIPVAGITVDIDEEIRSTTTPMIGADENSFTGFQMFSDPFSTGLPGTPFSVATGDFDEDGDDDIAVPDYDNRQILFFRNQHPNRSFAHTGTFFTTARPTAIKFYDLDEDGHLDLIAGGDTTAVVVFWGDGQGGNSGFEIVGTFGRVRSLEPGPTFSGSVERTIAITEDNGFGPTESYLGYLMHLGNRDLCHDVQSNSQGIDSIHATMLDFVVGDLSGDGGIPEIAAVTSSPFPPPLILINGISFVVVTSGPCADLQANGIVNELQLGTAGTAGHSSIIMGDFDGDTDLDLITLETFSSCTFVRNNGNLSFSSEPIPVAGAQGLASMDYENDGDLDFITVNDQLQTNGITVFLNDGTGTFTSRENCFFPFATGLPRGVIASDFDQDGKTDLAIVSSSGIDSLFVLYNLGGGTVGIKYQESENIPANFTLAQNYPNPFNPSTTIKFSIPEASVVTLKIFNILGEEVKTLINEFKGIGNHTTQFDASSLSSGIYLYRMKAGSFVETKKMLLLK